MTAERFSPADLVRRLDLLVLLVAVPVFFAVGAPIGGVLVAGGAWIVGMLAKAEADRRRSRALQSANRSAALSITAAAMLGRLWLLAGAILAAGLIFEREVGLSAAVLAAALVTAHLLGEALSQAFAGEEL